MPDLLSGNLEKPTQELAPQEVSGIEADEQTFENSAESKDTFLEEAIATEEAPVTQLQQTAAQAKPQPKPVIKDHVTVTVEKILEEGLGELYAALPDSAKPKFREKGEHAAIEIAAMVRSLKFKVRKALELIRDWLLTIPSVNKFFLEQEAKIKVDKLADLVKHHD
jgi:hypothetical protein